MYVIVSARMKTSSMSKAVILGQFFNGHFCSCPYNEVTGSVSVFVCVWLSVPKELAIL